MYTRILEVYDKLGFSQTIRNRRISLLLNYILQTNGLGSSLAAVSSYLIVRTGLFTALIRYASCLPLEEFWQKC